MAPAAPAKESTLERHCAKVAALQGCILLKLSNLRGWPDRLLLAPNGRVAFIEFKREGGRLSELQRYRLGELHKMHFPAYEVDNFTLFMRILNETLDPPQLPASRS